MKPRLDDTNGPTYLLYKHLPYLINRYFSLEPLPQGLRGSHKKTASIAAGFKTMSHQISGLPNRDEFWMLLKQHDAKVLRLYRHNIIKQITSDYITTKTRQCVVYDGKESAGTVKIRYPIANLERDINFIRSSQAYIDKNVIQYRLRDKLVIYEDYEFNMNYVSDHIMPYFIGKSVVVNTRTSKQNPTRLADRLLNYEELARELRKLNMESFIKDT
jgi:hypothetical protein